MTVSNDIITTLFNERGELYGVFIPAPLWGRIRSGVEAMLPETKKLQPEIPEPLEDWENLKGYWDFKYPINFSVACPQCGECTENWEEDDPRRFRLLAANLGGLVRFECLRCRSRITKRHFKNEIQTECCPACRSENHHQG